MKWTKKILKGLLLCVLSLSIMTGLWITEPKDVHAYMVYSEVHVVDTYQFYRGGSVAAFLKGLKITYPPASAIKRCKFGLSYLNNKGVRIKVSSGEIKYLPYDIEYEIELYSDCIFDYENLEVLLNGLRARIDEGPDNHYVSGYWQLDPYERNKITFDARGGKPVPKVQWIEYASEKIKKPKNPVKEGYKFLGWFFKDAGKYKLWNFSKPLGRNDDLTLYALWDQLPSPTTTTTTTIPPTTTITTTTPTTTTTTTTPSTTTAEKLTTLEITETEEISTSETIASDDLTSTAPVIGEETTAPDDKKEGGKNFPLLLIIIGALLLTWTVALIVFTVMRRRKK